MSEENLRQLYGREIVIILKDGTRHFGVLTSCGKSAVVLNGDKEEAAELAAISALDKRKAAQRSRRISRRTRTASADHSESSESSSGSNERPYWGPMGLDGIRASGPDVPSKVVIPLEPIDTVIVL
ncbi:hypothetical protein D3H35_18670 [Cohnella faecalis]|uniref:Uncharacterized protein n=1 Tax=Cohnella faecalis TaxID=2315694 RepID=A0A398CK16_9BACL|nr:hypothetical protein D3H35_18670 [Cohnella faecalis]